MQGTQVSKVFGAGLATVVAVIALMCALFTTQSAYAADADGLTAGAGQIGAASKTPDLSAKDATVAIAQTKSIKVNNAVEGQTGSYKWTIASGNKLVKLSNANKQTCKVKGLADGVAKLKVTFTTDSNVSGSYTVAVKVNGIKSTKTVAGIKYKRTGVNTVTFLKVTKDLKKKTIKVPNTVKLGDKKGYKATYKVTVVGKQAIQNQSKLTKVIVGNNVATIKPHAFCSNQKLQIVTIGTGVVTIEKKVVHLRNPKVKTITIKSTKLKSVKNMLKDNKSVKTVKVPKKMVKKYKKLFKQCGKKVKVVAI